DDVQVAAEVVAVPAAEEVGDQAGWGREERDVGEPVLGDAGDGQFPDREVGNEGEVLALPLDDVVGVEGRVRAWGGGDAAADQVYVLRLQLGPEVAGSDVDDVQLDLAAG